jgi:hypothetical protein
MPIASSTFVPTLVLVAAWLGWLDAGQAWATAFGVTLARLALLGPVSAWIARKPFSLWPVVAGCLLAVSIADIAIVKVMLIH